MSYGPVPEGRVWQEAGLGLMRTQSPMFATGRAYLDAITAELAMRAVYWALR
jgi:hypothetical protein